MMTRPQRMTNTKFPRRRTRETPVLRFSPTAWAKLVFLRDVDETEIGGFGISRPGALLEIEGFALVSQVTTPTTVVFDDQAVADFFEEQVVAGRQPAEFGRVWIHTHPGRCPQPSGTDEATFARVFGTCDWAVMVILAREGATYARLAWNVGPAGAIEIPVRVDYSRSFRGSDSISWQAEYDRCVQPRPFEILESDFGLASTPTSLVHPLQHRSILLP